ncbi:MAG: ATP-binding cassette domain-containing protein [Myxococcota bacterium]|nr:ATP-binding cassette domain-containing protein [Myxococcota bacterium]
MSESGIQCIQVVLKKKVDATAEKTILSEVNCRFDPGTVSAITGPVGTGKTSLLHILAGLDRPTSGVVMADGVPISRYTAPHRDRYRSQVGVAFQKAYFFEDETVLDNVILPLLPYAKHMRALKDLGCTALEQMGLIHLKDRAAVSLSGGERRRMGIVRALIGNRRFLFLDEPTSFQDPEGCERVVAGIEQAKVRGAVIAVATHDLAFIKRLQPDVTWTLLNGIMEPRP